MLKQIERVSVTKGCGDQWEEIMDPLPRTGMTRVRAAYTSIETAAVMNAKPPKKKKPMETGSPKNKMIIRTPARPDITVAEARRRRVEETSRSDNASGSPTRNHASRQNIFVQ